MNGSLIRVGVERGSSNYKKADIAAIRKKVQDLDLISNGNQSSSINGELFLNNDDFDDDDDDEQLLFNANKAKALMKQ